MSIFTITHTCGHQTEAQIVGRMADRQRKAAWLASRDCNACLRQRQRQAEAEATAAATAELKLPALVGSEKQVAWAAKLRVDALAAIPAILNGRPVTAELQAAIDRMTARTEAGWWIDNLREANRFTLEAALTQA